MMNAKPEPLVEFRGVSKWYGPVIGVNNLSCRMPGGITGLLGPNGAGKSTLLQLATGQLRPNQGEVRVLGAAPWNHPSLNRLIGLCPEQDAFWEWMPGLEFVRTCARLSGLPAREAREAAERAFELVKMMPHRKRAVRGYSKGMRQRTKIAQAMVHDPHILFLDEPLTGTDPLARREIMDVILELGARGKGIVVSSHVLHEVRSLTARIVLLNRGRLVADGDIRQIRDLIDEHPHRIVLKAPRPRDLAAELVAHNDVVGVELERAGGGLLVETRKPDAFYSRLAELALDRDNPILEVWSEDDNLEAVFKYLVRT